MNIPITLIHQIQQSALLSLLITFLSWGCSVAEHRHTCPIGYTIAYKKYKSDDPVCYRLKGPEKFADKFQGCAGNLYTTKLYYSLNIKETNKVLWTDYKTMYRGGLFIDWSYTDSMGDSLPLKDKVNYDPNFSDEEACIIIDPIRNFTATNCDKKHYRFCVVRSFSKKKDRVHEGCQDSDEFWRYFSPRPTCLAPIRTVKKTLHEAYWAQAEETCSKRQASLLNEGWIYASDPLISASANLFHGLPRFLLGIVLSPGNTTSWFDSARGGEWIPTSDWNFNDTNLTTESTANVALIGNFWYLVNSSSLFSNIVICERPVQLRRVMMNLTVNSEKKLVLSTNDTVNENDMKCFTDSKTYTPVSFRVKYVNSTENFIYSPDNDGYYWCVLTNSRKYYVTESNKVLFIRDKKSLVNYYAVKVSFKKLHLTDNLKNWKNKLEEYMFYRTQYIKEFGELRMDNQASEQIFKEFKASHPLLKYKEGDLIHNITLKRYIQKKEALLQVELKPEVMPIPPWTWGNMEVIYMKPVYYCKELDSIPMLPLGTSITSSGCRTYTCVGDFNEGVQWVTTAASGCTTTTSEIPIEFKLQQVLDGVEKLLQGDTVTVEGIQKSFTQVNELLQTQEDIKIPGSLLSHLDDLSTRIDLNGSSNVSVIRSNIALLMADAGPTAPVKGFRVAARDADKFTENDFEIIYNHLDPMQMTANNSEAVVYLPDSIANSSTRISFMVFRNDRAFQNNNKHYLVNSLILSITVKNLSLFDDGQTVDLHLSPINQHLDHSVNRSCVYWYFREDGTGYWSTEGCTFIKSTGEGILDICRCTHLTHFAEVYVQRCTFSDRHEETLEVLTIIGCCLSMFGICMVGVTAAVLKPWRKDYNNKIWLQLCIAILLLVFSFLVKIFMKFDHDSIPCMLVGVALHYSVLASFCWMLVAAVVSYRRLVIVFSRDASHKLLRASAFSWGAPCAVVGLLLSIDPRAYAGQFGEKAVSGAICYPSGLGLWLAVYAPITIMLLVNWTLFTLIVRSVFNPRTISRHGDTNEAVRCASVSCFLVFLFGLPWVFGLFACNIVAAYLFTLTATYQGFVLFIFFVLGNKKTRDLWLKKLQSKQMHRISVTLWPYTHRRPGLYRLVEF